MGAQDQAELVHQPAQQANPEANGSIQLPPLPKEAKKKQESPNVMKNSQIEPANPEADGSSQPFDPCQMCTMQDPRSPEQQVGIVAFYFPGREEVWDTACQSSFLGNFYDVETESIVVK